MESPPRRPRVRDGSPRTHAGRAGFAAPVANHSPVTEAQMRRAIARKRDGEQLEATVWMAIVAGYVTGDIEDAQLAALLMACIFRPLDQTEIEALAEAMIASGERLAAAAPDCVDKHSSGGVADTVSLVVVPLVAACGVPVAKLS